MKRLQTTMLMLALFLTSLSHANGQSLGTAFTYQGQLKDGGQAADGMYDLRFKIFDAATGGTQIGGTIQLANYPVTNGLFTVDLDFTPAVFNDNLTPNERWLEVLVEQTTLSPRQELSGVPYSIQTRGLDVVEDGGGMRVGVGRAGIDTFNVYKNTTGFGGMRVETNATGEPFYGYTAGNITTVYHYLDSTSGDWKLYNAGERLTVRSDGFVGIGRDDRISSTEIFGIFKNTQNNDFGGMYVETSNGGQPYYGYSTGGDVDAYSYFDSPDDAWRLWVKGDNRIAVLDNGNVGIGVHFPAFKFQVNGSAAKPGGGSWSNASDRRLKKNINDLEGSLDKLMKLRGVSFEYLDPKSINELDGERIGVVAQEVEKVFPDWVEKRSDGYKAVTFRGFEALTVEALRELRDEKNQQITKLQGENQELRGDNDDLHERLDVLEEQVQQLLAASQSE